MPISRYLQLASSNLTRAAEEQLREAEEKRRKMTQLENELKSRISDTKQNMRQKESRLGDSGINDAIRAVMVKEIRDDSQNISNLESELTNLRRQIDDEIRQMESAAQNLTQQANNLNSWAASA